MSLNYSRFLWVIVILTFVPAALISRTSKSYLLELTLFSFNSIHLSFPIVFDFMSLLFISTVLLISANVLNFSNLYIEDEVFISRFTHLVILLIGSIAALILIPHITALLLGWDGLGLVSFLLVTLYASPKALGAGMLTALTNRIGDALILISISFIVEWSYHLELVRFAGQPIAALCIMVAAITKSAQLPFSAWLPAAIEAPTPVSALVHSSTLVTAGVYLLIRLYRFLRQSRFFNASILIIGAVTRLFAGISAIVELDLKKIIALSTLSQLGFIMIRIGLGAPKLAFFHLLTHAMFKALLFICAGTLIHFHGHAQDIRQIGGIRIQLPVTTAAISISSLALCAVPFISGLYSKDAILEAFFWAPYSFVVVLIALIATLLTGAYSARLFFCAIVSSQKSNPITRLSEPMKTPIFALSLGALMRGATIMRTNGPLALEPFSPFAKSILTLILFSGPALVIWFIGPTGRKNFKATKWLFYSAGRGMLLLNPITTHKILT